MSHQQLVAHLFRHEYGLIVASLLRRFGIQNLERVEDSVMFSMKQALEIWSRHETPDDPSAWLYRVAYHQVLTELRNIKRRTKILEENQAEVDELIEHKDIPLSVEMDDSMLRMLFIACHCDIPVESQLVFTLKSLCGFNVKEIAVRLFISEDNVYKRFSRARDFLKKQNTTIDHLTYSEMSERLPMVLRVLYLVFTEGHLSSKADMAIRIDLCNEAVRLTGLLSQSQVGNQSETLALLALMFLHSSKMSTRQDDSGALLLLEDQDRSLWNKQAIANGLEYLQDSAKGEYLSRYHVEANIVAEHCLAKSFKLTRWDKITESYELLEKIAPSVLNQLNRAIALAEWQSPKAGLTLLSTLKIPMWLDRTYYWNAVLADLQFRCGDVKSALGNARLAITKSPSESIKKALQKRFEHYVNLT